MNKLMKRLLWAGMLAVVALLVTSPAMAYEWTMYGLRVATGVFLGYLLLYALRRREAGAQAVGMLGRVDADDLMIWCVPAAVLGARLLYCIIRFSYYFVEMGPLSVLRIWEGGFLLYGAAFGAMAAAAVLARRRRVSAALALDEIAAPGLLMVAVSRLAEPLTGEGVGTWIENEAFMRLPFAAMNAYEEWQLAVFLFEAAAALVLLIPVLKKPVGKGERILTSLLLYGCCQVVLESLRMDSCLKIGFVRVSQVISAVMILAVTLVRARSAGGNAVMIRRGAFVALGTAVVGGLEWALDKTPVSNVLIYAVMIAVCAGFAANGTCFAQRKEA